MSYCEKLKHFCETTETTDDVRYLTAGRILHETRFTLYMVPWSRELLLIENNIDGGKG